MTLKLTCPECKTELDLKQSSYKNIKKDDIIECNICGITLLIVDIQDDGQIITEITDEGK